MAPEKCGMLKKSGGGMLKRDQERWFELSNKRLYYYKQNPENGEAPLGCIPVGSDVVVAEDTKQKSISVSGPHLPKSYTLFCSSESELNEWVTAIENSKESSEKGLDTTGDDSDDGDKKVGLDDFEPLCVVGKGSFGKVMQVKKKDTGEIFAMKAMNKEVILRENLVEHTKAEKNILGRINHPYIVKLHFAFQTSDKLYLILDFLSGGEVFFHLSQKEKFPEEWARHYTAQIGLAIGYIHSLDIIYRDLKPENCVLDKEGNCCITDFGLAKPNIQGQDAKTFCGTPEYLAPEFLTGGGHGKAVDWWSLGILLYEMISGLPPFYSENVNEMYGLILQKELVFDEPMSEAAMDMCRSLLERDPEKRLQDLDKFKAHKFFEGMDWEAMMEKKLPVPFTPDPAKLNFDDEFTSEPARHTMANVKKVGTTEFDNFTFNGR
eukprot:TRINITY_DN4263_c2_g1_i1.p1 TRINITY_DN4263_c2_g1~~TRINITY_DN4263_c2_g1_i1.p1  ORF type:complete len:435 (+),score=87.86 TRINITY_DN4263_c2_g1_i1:97-1401(+)